MDSGRTHQSALTPPKSGEHHPFSVMWLVNQAHAILPSAGLIRKMRWPGMNQHCDLGQGGSCGVGLCLMPRRVEVPPPASCVQNPSGQSCRLDPHWAPATPLGTEQTPSPQPAVNHTKPAHAHGERAAWCEPDVLWGSCCLPAPCALTPLRASP